MVYLREDASARYLIAANMQREATVCKFEPSGALAKDLVTAGQMTLATSLDRSEERVTNEIALEAYQGAIILLDGSPPEQFKSE